MVLSPVLVLYLVSYRRCWYCLSSWHSCEACGYMARVAFIMDRIFRKFGLSGKSFIPMLIGSGCGVPGVMASRTIENDRDRKMTIMTTTFIPCGAKLPIIALIAGAFFDGAPWVAPSAYFVGIAAIIMLRYHLKENKNVCRRSGSVRYGASGLPYANRWQCTEKYVGAWMVLHQKSWYHYSAYLPSFSGSYMNFGLVDGTFGMLDAEQLN